MTISPGSITRLLREKDIESLTLILNELSAFEIADIISKKSFEDQLLVFNILIPNLAANTFDFLPFRTQKKILHSLPSTKAANMLAEMRPDDRTAFLEELPRPVLNEYLKLLSPEERAVASKLLGYPEDSIGRLMTTDYIAVKMDWTVEQVLDHIRAYGHDSETISMIYVVDDNNILIDDIRIRDFLFYPKGYKVRQLSDNKFVYLAVNEQAENAINTFKHHGRVALPVVDEEGHLLGIVTIDDILKLAADIGSEEVQKIGGTEALDAPYMETPFFELISKRAKWLVVLFIGEGFTATAMGFFEAEISKAVVLALFLPLIISSGGNAGSQSTTLIIRAMALGEIKLKDWWRVMRREIFCGLFLGTILGSIGFLRVTAWSSFSNIYGPHWFLIALTISFALLGVVLWGSLMGSMLPIILRRIGVDPATASAPLVATLVDVTGIVLYFGVAMLLLKGTLL